LMVDADVNASAGLEAVAAGMETMKVSENQAATHTPDQVANSFEDMDLPEDILRAVYGAGFDKPSPVQSKAVLPHKSGKDVIVQSQSGTGKTLAFVLGAALSIDRNIKKTQILVMSHTRELVNQTREVFAKVLKHSDITYYDLVGSKATDEERRRKMQNDMDALTSGKQIIIGTTGRIKNMLRRFDISHIKQIILDEADRMIEDTDFVSDIAEICGALPLKSNLQICLYSATIPEKVKGQIQELMREDKFELLVPSNEVALKGIKQFYVQCPDQQFKASVLMSLTKDLPMETMICFCNRKEEAVNIQGLFAQHGFPFSLIHGDLTDKERETIMADFRNGKIRYLIASDLLARGIDVQQVSLVVNFSLPISREDYIHRVGRGGRYGRKGIAINLVSDDELRTLNSFEEHYSFKIAMLPAEPASILED